MTKYDRSKNVDIFNQDILDHGAYAYSADKLSARLSHQVLNEAAFSCYDFVDKSILDLCCGDGFYSMDFIKAGAASILGLDLAPAAVQKANERAQEMGLADKARFETGDIYNLREQIDGRTFDCAMFRACLHHLPDPGSAIAAVAPYVGSLVIIEPNGYNPVVKILEKASKYHREHDEKSFTLKQICAWVEQAGFTVKVTKVCNLVPCFCPDWMAKLCHAVAPAVEAIPGLRLIACGQFIVAAEKP